MNSLRFNPLLFVALILFATPLFVVSTNAQDAQGPTPSAALIRGFRTGYSDGYQAGVSDLATHAARDFRNKTEYQHGDRAYSSSFGTLEEYRSGYQQGYEAGYSAGYDRQPFDSSIPTDLKPREQTDSSSTNAPVNPNTPSSGPPASGIAIPHDTVMRIELLNNITTEDSHKGDHFQARVVEPQEYENATIEGTVTDVKRPGKVRGVAELQLSFDQIRMADGRSAKLSAQVTEVVRSGGEGVGKVDAEGGVQGQDSTKRDVQKIGGAAGIGAVIGAIAGGGSGAAIGATIGAGVGTAGVMTDRGHDIHLYHGQQLRIRTAGDTSIQ
jgi:hypothetical protein